MTATWLTAPHTFETKAVSINSTPSPQLEMHPLLPFWAKQYLLHMNSLRPDLYRALSASGELEAAALRLNELAKAHHRALIRCSSYSGYSSTELELRADREIMERFIRLAPGQPDVALNGIVPELSHR